jgi:hypothetical protein
LLETDNREIVKTLREIAEGETNEICRRVERSLRFGRPQKNKGRLISQAPLLLCVTYETAQ